MTAKQFISRCREKMRVSNNHRKRHYGETFPEDLMSDEDILALLDDINCVRCEGHIDLEIRKGGMQFTLDRIDNTLPYQKGNVKLSHYICNCAEKHWGRKGWSKDQYKAYLLQKTSPCVSELFEWIGSGDLRHRLDEFFEL